MSISELVHHAHNWLSPVLHFLGLAVAVWAFQRCGKRGYLVLAFYFALCVFSLVAMPHINRAIRARREPDWTEQARAKMDAAIREAIDRVRAEEGYQTVPDIEDWTLPLGPILLVAGLWFVAKREPRKEAEPSSGANAASPRRSL